MTRDTTFSFDGRILYVHEPTDFGLSHWIDTSIGKPRCNLMGVGFNTTTMRWTAHVRHAQGRLVWLGEFMDWENAAGRVLGVMEFYRIGYFRPHVGYVRDALEETAVYRATLRGKGAPEMWTADVYLPPRLSPRMNAGDNVLLNLGLYDTKEGAVAALREARACYQLGDHSSAPKKERVKEAAREVVARQKARAMQPVYELNAETGAYELRQ